MQSTCAQLSQTLAEADVVGGVDQATCAGPVLTRQLLLCLLCFGVCAGHVQALRFCCVSWCLQGQQHRAHAL